MESPKDALKELEYPNDHDLSHAKAASKKETCVDTGWSWIVLAASFVIHLIIFGQMMCMAIFYTEFVNEFSAYGPVANSWLIATQVALGALAGPIGSILANRFGFQPVIIIGALISATGFFVSYFVYNFWLLFFTFGVLTGLGSGIVYSPSFGILALYFDKRKSVATAAVTVGVGLGMFILPPLERFLVAQFTWRGAVLITAALTLNIIPCAALFSRHARPPLMTFQQSADVSLFRKISFYALIFQYFLMAGFNVFVINSLQFAAETRLISKDDTPLILSAQGICNVFGRLSAVAISSNKYSSKKPVRFAVFHLTTIGGGLAIACYSLPDTLLGLCVCSGLVGCLLGCRWALLPGIQLDILSPQRFSTSWSYGMFCLGLGTLTLPPFGEWLAEMTGNSQLPFFVGGFSIVAGSTLTLFVQFCQPSWKGHRSKKQLQQNFAQPL